MRAILNTLQNLKRLEKATGITKSLFNGYECSDMEIELFELPAKYGGLGIINPSAIPDCKYRNSQILTQERSQLIKN